MTKEILTYTEINSIRSRLEAEGVRNFQWEELIKLDGDTLIKEFQSCSSKYDVLNKRREKLCQLADKFSPICRYFSTKYFRIKHLASKNSEYTFRNICRRNVAFMIAEDRGITTDSVLEGYALLEDFMGGPRED